MPVASALADAPIYLELNVAAVTSALEGTRPVEAMRSAIS